MNPEFHSLLNLGRTCIGNIISESGEIFFVCVCPSLVHVNEGEYESVGEDDFSFS